MHHGEMSVKGTVIDHDGFFQFAIVHATLKSTLKALRDQLDLWKHRPYRIESGVLDVRRITLSPHGPHTAPSIQTGYVLAEVRGRDGVKTLFTSSVNDGANSLLCCLSRRVPRGILKFRVESLNRKYPGNLLCQFEDFETVRLVRAMKDGDRWEFFEIGKPLWFEDPGFYKARNKKDRITSQIIAEYIERLGYGSLENEFWCDPNKTATYVFEEGFIPGETS
jgi:hypothetical protein